MDPQKPLYDAVLVFPHDTFSMFDGSGDPRDSNIKRLCGLVRFGGYVGFFMQHISDLDIDRPMAPVANITPASPDSIVYTLEHDIHIPSLKTKERLGLFNKYFTYDTERSKKYKTDINKFINERGDVKYTHRCVLHYRRNSAQYEEEPPIQAGGDDYYHMKYLKYKNKYLQLKHKI